MSGGITLFRILGIPVRVNASWLLVLAFLTWTLAVGYFPRVLPDLPVGALWIKGFVAALLLFVSVFLHELAHAAVALRYGIPVSSITLHVFGGVSQLERDPDAPGAEFVIAVVGPLTSFALAVLLAAARVAVPVSPAVEATLTYLAFVNVMLGVFNLVPGFPLDGGRLLRAVLWRLRGDLRWATRIASRAGAGVGMLLIVLGLLRSVGGEPLGGLWMSFIGLFLLQAAQGSYQQLRVQQALGGRRVADVMARDVVSVPADLPVARVADELFWQHRVSSFPVVDGGRVLGIVGLDHLKTVAAADRPTTPVRAIMVPLSESLVARPEDSLWTALTRLGQNGVGRLAVIEGDRLVGYLSVKDITQVLATSPDPDATPRGGR